VAISVSAAGQYTYSYWDQGGGVLSVARGNTTNLDAYTALQPVEVPAGLSLDSIQEMAFDANGNLHTWVKGLKRYVGTSRDIDGADNAAPVAHAGLKGTAGRTTAIHELGHALGATHEQKRPDRDSYVWVDPAVASSVDYSKLATTSTYKSVGGYDFASFMHYPSGDSLKRADLSSFTIQDYLSVRDLQGMLTRYGVGTMTLDELRQADVASYGLAYSPLAGMCDRDIVGADFDVRDGSLHSFYDFGGKKRGRGTEFDLGSTAAGNYTFPSIAGETPAIIGIALGDTALAPGVTSVFTWYSGKVTATCTSGVYVSTGTFDDLARWAAPACVTVYSTSYDADDIRDMAISNHSGSVLVYTLYDNDRISVGTTTNLAGTTAPTAYDIPGSLAADDVYGFTLKGGVATFYGSSYRITRDADFKTKF
jgi:hypothetical protein